MKTTEEVIIEKYEVEADEVKAKIIILGRGGKSFHYKLIAPEYAPPTLALLEEVRRELITEVIITTTEILDPKIISRLKQKFRREASILLDKKLPGIREEVKKSLIGTLIHEMLGLGNVEFLLNDPQLEEIVILAAKQPTRVYHKVYGWLETNISIATEDQIQNYANIIARRVGRQITTLNPLLDAHLITGDRANAVLYPISTEGNTITIRKFARDPWTVTDFIDNKTTNSDLMALIWLAIEYEMNILISGGTASGKTSLLNVCMPFIPPKHRVISIEQTRELSLPKFLYWCPLTTRLPNPEGLGEVTMLDLLVNSLRMRPDRIILGEMRRKEEAEVLFEAMHTGHSVYATVHADSLVETVRRLVNPPIQVPENLLEAVDLNVVMFRDRRRSIRRVYQVGEFIATEEAGEIKIKPNLIYRWKPATDQIIPHAESLRLFEDLSRHTGFSMKEINQEIQIKKRILEWMVKNKIRHVDEVGKIMNNYYIDPKIVLKQAHIKA